MKGLLKKDMISLYKGLPIMIVITVIVLGSLFYFDAGIGSVSFLTIYLAMQAVTTIIPEKMTGWYLYQTTLPISRKGALREKYWFAIGLLIAGFLLGLAVVILFVPSASGDDLQISSMIGWILALSTIAVGIPLLTALPKSSFMIGIVGGFIPGAIAVALWSQLMSDQKPVLEIVDGIPVAMETFVPDMHVDFLWTALFIMAALVIVSMIVTPLLLSRTDQN